MKKFLVLLLGFCFAVPAFAGTIGAVSNEAWLDHVSQMQSMRQQIMALVTKSNPTVEDRQNLDLLNLTFTEKKAEWEQYLESVAQGKQTETEVKKTETEEPAKVEKADDTAKKPWARYNKHGRKHKKHGRHVCKADCSKHKKCDEAKKACEKKCEEMCKDGCKGLCKEECKGLTKEECKKACGDKKPWSRYNKRSRKNRHHKHQNCKEACADKAKADSKEACEKACTDKAKTECCSNKGDKCCKKTGKACADKAKTECKEEACADKAKAGCKDEACADKAKAGCKDACEKACTDKK